MRKDVMFGVALALAAFVGLIVSVINTVEPAPAYVLVAATSRHNGAVVETVSMQEFSSKGQCEYALGFIQGYAEGIGGECVPK